MQNDVQLKAGSRRQNVIDYVNTKYNLHFSNQLH